MTKDFSSFGEKAVGISFNPSEDPMVDNLKTAYAEVINLLHEYRLKLGTSPEVARLTSIAITEAQGAQMWAVKAVTWKD